jgi:tripeptidyl-peptidase-1
MKILVLLSLCLTIILFVKGKILFEQVDIPNEFAYVSRASPHREITFHLFLKKRNVQVLENLFWEVSNPKSKQYGKYLTTDQIAERFGASEQSIHAVTQWLNHNKVHSYSMALSKDLIQVKTTTGTAEKLFGTTISSFFDKETGNEIISAHGEIFVPVNIKKHVDLISGLNGFLQKQKGEVTFGQSISLKQQRRVSSTMNTEPPLSFFYIYPRDGLIEVYLIVACNFNGSSSSLPNCSDIQSLYVTAQTTMGNQPTNPIAVQNLPDSFIASDFANGTNYNLYETCLFTTNFLPYNLSAYLMFNNDSTSSTIYAPVLYYSNKFTTPNNIATYYGTNYLQNTNPTNRQAFIGLIGQYFSPSDLNNFFNYFGLPSSNVSKIVGINNSTNAGLEASLDVQYIMGVGLNVPTWFWSFNQNTTFDDLFFFLSNLTNAEIPYVVSMSYEFFFESPSLYPTMLLLNQEFMKLGIRGVSVFAGSGDGGFGGRNAPSNSSLCQNFVAKFPASSPYVTAVGATMWSTQYSPACDTLNTCQEVREIACMADRGGIITTGGGFSNFFSMPAYQMNLVNSYLNNSAIPFPQSGSFNTSGRAYPDISASGSNYIVFINGSAVRVSGTSASTPVVAGMVSLLNGLRLNVGLPTLGFLNPLIYLLYQESSNFFNDIVVGNNRCGGGYALNPYLQVPYCCSNGFYAAPGWDAVTGLGTPRFNEFSNNLNTVVNKIYNEVLVANGSTPLQNSILLFLVTGFLLIILLL